MSPRPFLLLLLALATLRADPPETKPAAAKLTFAYEDRELRGWKVHIRKELLTPEKKAITEKGIALVEKQLEDIERLIPPKPLADLKKIPLWFSPWAEGNRPGRAAYHPAAQWLKENGRDPAMAKGVEFTNLNIMDKEVLRMPLLTLHELAHGYHHQVLGLDYPDIKACWQRAVDNKSYDHVTHRDWQGKISGDGKAYAVTNYKEFFSETTEAFFGQNDVFPYTRPELEKHDPETVKMLQKAWGVK